MRVPFRMRGLQRITPVTLALSLTGGALIATGPAHAATRAPATAPATGSTRLSAAAASARSHATGQSVVADALTTTTDQTTANPDGSFTLTTSPVPVRVARHGSWVPLDATLTRNPDGAYSPAATPSSLQLSGGGNGPLAILTLGGRQLTVTLPVTLPAPTVTGATATYPGLLTDVDLVVTATPQGGYSDVFVVKSAAAAANPALHTLMQATLTSTGVSLATDSAGNLTAATSTGTPVFTAPAPAAWDSATTATKGASSVSAASASPSPSPSPTGSTSDTDPNTGAPLTSSVAGPGEGAHQASLGASLANNTLTLTPPASLLTGSTTSYPVYLDPSVGPSVASWTMVNSAFATTSYWNAGTNSRMQVGYNGWSSPFFTARSFTTLNLSGVPSGAQVSSAQVNFFEDVAPSCSARNVELWATGAISSSTTWKAQPAWNSKIGTQNVAKGYSGCSAGGVGFDITSQVASTRGAGGTALTLGLRATDETDAYAWKQFNGDLTTETKTTASVTYDQKPTKPTGLYTSPATNCSTTTLGDTAVTLNAPVSDPDGGSLTTTFNLYYASDNTKANLLTSSHGIPSDTYTGNSGVTAALPLPESFFKTLVGTTPTAFTWKAQSSDGTLTSPTSDECTFTWDASRPGSPAVAATSNPTTGNTCPLSPTTPTNPVGTLCSFTLTPPVGYSISGYLYQLNQSAPLTVNTTGSAIITVTLPRIVNTLTISALSPGGNVGSDITVTIDATALTPPANDGDLTGDGTPDLIIPGNTSATSNTPPGLWLAAGNRDGSVNPTTVNIGINGLGYSSPGTPTDWNGAQALTGTWCGLGTQDALAYLPGAAGTGNPNGGGGAILCGDASAAPLHTFNPVSGNEYPITANSFQDPGTGVNATTVANGGSENDVDAGGIVNLFYGTVTTGTNTGQLDVFAMAANQPGTIGDVIDLASQNTPTGGTDWNHWTITAAQTPSGTAMYLWNSTTGDLYLWTGITLNNPSFDQTTGITYTTHPKIASGWHTGATNLQLRAADINADGTPDLWAATTTPGAAPTSSAYLLTNLSPTTATFTAQPTQNLTTTAHTWLLNDGTSGTANPAADSTGTLTLNGTSGATWHTGDMYNPDVAFDGSSGYLNSATAAVAPNTSFTVSAWVKPTVNNGGVIFSQDGTNDSAFLLYPNGSQWEFGMNNNNTNTWSYDGSIGGSYLLGVWTHLTLTYNASNRALTLYDNGIQASSITATNPPNTTGKFVIGADQGDGARGAYFNGQIADVQIWTSTQTPLPDTAHAWLLNDATTGSATTARDTGTTTATALPMALTGTTGSSWHTGDTFSPDAQLDGNTGALRASAAAVTPNASFTISAWAKPVLAGGVLFSQDGTNDSAFLLYPGPSSWIFGMNNAGTTGWSFNSAGGGTVSLNTWTHVVAVYNAATTTATLYLNGTPVTSFTDTAPPTTLGAFQLGDDQSAGTRNAYFNGQIADTQTWNTALTPTQIAAIN